jgi:hypothetical protein
MGRPKIVEMNYHDFSRALQQAINAGTRLERSDGDQWTQYVAEHQINEVAMSSWGHSKLGPVKPVIISTGHWAGYYVYSVDEEGCLKWTREDD